jgi:monoamine oxidase
MPTLYTALRARHAPVEKKPVAYGKPLGLFAEVVQQPAEIPPPQVPQAKHISLTDRFDLKQPKEKPGHVVVIGAGLAGLSAAHELTTVGYKVTVLEAQRNHIGGRVKSLRKWIGDKVVESGGELIGTNHPAWRSYASKFQLPFWELPSQEADGPIVLKGQLLNDQQSGALLKEMQKAFAILDSEAKKIPNAFEPWTAPNAKALDRLSLAERIRSLPVSLLCMLAVDELLEGDNGVPTNLQSYLGVLAMVKGGGCDKYWDDTETHRCAGGNVTLAEKLLANLKPKSLRRGCEVKTIAATKNRLRSALTTVAQLRPTT